MPRDVIRKRSNDVDFDYLSAHPAPVGTNPIEILMAAPLWQEPANSWTNQVSDSVRCAIATLDERDAMLIEGKYIWGKSYSQLADMMGWSAKSSAYKAVKKAEKKLRDILLNDPFIREMLGE